jgi:hypothetical protein
MKRLAFTSASLICCLAVTTAAFAQAAKSPAPSAAKKDAAPAVAPTPVPVSEELMKARMRPAVKGTAYIEIIPGPTKPVKGELVSVIKVRNVSPSPIIGLKVDQYFYASQKEVSACTSRVRHPIAANEIAEVTMSCPSKAGINSSNMMFTHANGAVKPQSVKKFGEADNAKKAPAAAPAKKK